MTIRRDTASFIDAVASPDGKPSTHIQADSTHVLGLTMSRGHHGCYHHENYGNDTSDKPQPRSLVFSRKSHYMSLLVFRKGSRQEQLDGARP